MDWLLIYVWMFQQSYDQLLPIILYVVYSNSCIVYLYAFIRYIYLNLCDTTLYYLYVFVLSCIH